MFLLGILIFKGLTARRLYKSFGVKGLNTYIDIGIISHSTYYAYGYSHRNTHPTCYMFLCHGANLRLSIAQTIDVAMYSLQDKIYKYINNININIEI
jgi:hypothetical protein